MDDRPRPRDGVAGGEHAFFGRAPGVVVGDETRVGQRQVVGAVAEPGRVAGRHDDGRRGELEARAAELLAAALLAHDTDALDALRLAALGLDLLGQGAELDLDALLEGGGEVARADRDVVGLVLGDHDDVPGALAARRAGHVEGGDAVADHDDLLRELDGPALAHALEQLEAVQGGVVAGDHVARLLPVADADDHRVEPGVEEPVGVDLVAQLGLADEADAGLPERLEFLLDDLPGQPELGDAVAQRPAGLLVGVVHGDLVAALREEPRGCEAGRAGADDGDPPAGRHARHQQRAAVVGGRPVQGADGDGFVDVAAAAHGLAVARAHAPEDAGERQLLAHDAGRAAGVAGGERRHVRRDVDVRGARVRARRLTVGVVVREVHLEVALAARADALGVRLDDLAVLDPRGAGRLELVEAFDLDHAQAAGAPRGHAFLMAERGDVDPFAPRHVEHGLALAGGELAAVDGELDGSLGTRAHCCLPSTSAGCASTTGTASNLHT